MKKKITLILLVCITVMLTGCPKPSTKTKMPEVLADRIIYYELSKYDADQKAYDAAIEAKDFTTAKIKRDELIFRLKRNIDANYADFEHDIYVGKASSNILFDITELGASAAIGITNGERAKTIIGTALTAFKGGRKSIDVNFFREQTTESLIQTMRASRSTIETKINLGLQNGVQNYNLEESLGDLINYFFAGSLANALVELSKTASRKAEEEKAKTDNAVTQRLQKELGEAVTIDGIRNKLFADLNSKDVDVKAAARARILVALENLKKNLPADFAVKFKAEDSNEVLFAELQRILKKAAIMTDEIPTSIILSALNNTGGK